MSSIIRDRKQYEKFNDECYSWTELVSMNGKTYICGYTVRKDKSTKELIYSTDFIKRYKDRTKSN